MKAIRVARPGPSSVLECVDLPVPVIGAGELLVKLEAIGVNFLDIQQRLERYPGGVSFPYTPGFEGAGRVVEAGAEVRGVAPGDRVAVCDVLGCYADYLAVPFERAVAVSDAIDTRSAAAGLLQGVTALVFVSEIYPVASGDWVLVQAGAGGTGRMLVQAAKARGAVVVATASSEAKAAVARAAGADHSIVYVREDFVAACRGLAGFPGFAVVYDSVGSATLEKGLTLLKAHGMMVSLGKSAGPLAPFDLDLLNRYGSLTIARPNVMHSIRDPAALAARAATVFADLAAGRTKLLIDRDYPLAKAAEAQDALMSRQTVGKLLLQPEDSS